MSEINPILWALANRKRILLKPKHFVQASTPLYKKEIEEWIGDNICCRWSVTLTKLDDVWVAIPSFENTEELIRYELRWS